MASQSSPRTPQSTSTNSSTPSAPSKSIQSQSSDYNLRPIPMANTLVSPPCQRANAQAGRPRGGRPASPSHRSSPARASSPSRSPASRGNGRIGARTPGRPTIRVFSTRKAIGKRLVLSSSGGHVMQVAALQVVMPKSLVWQNHLNYPGSSAIAITIKATPKQTHFKWNNTWSVG